MRASAQREAAELADSPSVAGVNVDLGGLHFGLDLDLASGWGGHKSVRLIPTKAVISGAVPARSVKTRPGIESRSIESRSRSDAHANGEPLRRSCGRQRCQREHCNCSHLPISSPALSHGDLPCTALISR